MLILQPTLTVGFDHITLSYTLITVKKSRGKKKTNFSTIESVKMIFYLHKPKEINLTLF